MRHHAFIVITLVVSVSACQRGSGSGASLEQRRPGVEPDDYDAADLPTELRGELELCAGCL